MTTRMIAVALAMTALLPLAAAHAGPAAPGVDRGQQQALDRIAQGVRSGALTEGEARRLYQRERELDARVARMERDGRLSHEERRRARAELDELHAEIDRKLGNRRHASLPLPGVQQRQQMARQRIHDGIASGMITPAEAQRLAQRENDVARLQARVRRDGVVTAEEHRLLRDEVAMLNGEVDRMLSNQRRVDYRR